MIDWEEETTDTVDTAKRKHWVSTCGKYKVTFSESLFGLGTRSYSFIRVSENWALTKVHEGHRHTEAAFHMCETHFNIASKEPNENPTRIPIAILS